MTIKTVFITFAGPNIVGPYNVNWRDGSQAHYHAAGRRLEAQAIALGLFDEVRLFTEADLMADSLFWLRHGEWIESQSRGYGYWIWKSFIIKQTMATMADGDVLLYLDCGCEIDVRKQNIFREFFDLVKQELFIGTRSCLESDYTKRDLLRLFDVTDDRSDILWSEQFQSGALLFLVCPQMRSLVDDWYFYSCEYGNLDDSPSVEPEMPSFVQHRHDQSILSLLVKLRGYDKCPWQLTACVDYARNKTGVSVLSSL